MKIRLEYFSIALLFATTLSNCTTTGTRFAETNSKVQRGKASYYSVWTNRGTHTASGEPLRNHAMTAAHKTLPFGTKVKVTNLVNNRSQVVRITDRGPYIQGRIIDVTKGVARKLNFINAGIVPVEIRIVD